MVCDGYHEGGIYKLNIAPCVSYIASELLIDLWHQRFRHLNQDSLVKNTSLVEGLPSLQKVETVYEGCMFRKQHRHSFPSDAGWKADRPFKLIHSDIMGPVNAVTQGGNRFVLTFIDDHSRYIWIYMLKAKLEALDKFKVVVDILYTPTR